ncbi:MAG: hypothetical protein NVSMB25_02590 [Thermoleophilaceae bacterium]
MPNEKGPAEPEPRPPSSERESLAELRMQVRHHRQRRDLYRAKVYGPRPTSEARMRALEQAYALAESRLRRAERTAEGRALAEP